MLTTRVIPARSNRKVRTVAVPALGSAMAIAAVALTHSAVDIAGGGVSALMPTIRHRFHLSAAGIGALVAAVALCTSMSQPFAGRMADRWAPNGSRQPARCSAPRCSRCSGSPAACGSWLHSIVVGGFSSAAYHPASVVMAGVCFRIGPSSPSACSPREACSASHSARSLCC